MNLTTCVFEGTGEASAVARRVRHMAGADTDCLGWAVVRWDPDCQGPRSEVSGPAGWEDTNLAWFWSLVLGVTFRVPLLAAAFGSARGLDPQLLTAAGIHDTLMNRLRDEVTPGRSAISVLLGDSGAPEVQGLIRHRSALVLHNVQFTARQQVALLGGAA